MIKIPSKLQEAWENAVESKWVQNPVVGFLFNSDLRFINGNGERLPPEGENILLSLAHIIVRNPYLRTLLLVDSQRIVQEFSAGETGKGFETIFGKVLLTYFAEFMHRSISTQYELQYGTSKENPAHLIAHDLQKIREMFPLLNRKIIDKQGHKARVMDNVINLNHETYVESQIVGGSVLPAFLGLFSALLLLEGKNYTMMALGAATLAGGFAFSPTYRAWKIKNGDWVFVKRPPGKKQEEKVLGTIPGAVHNLS